MDKDEYVKCVAAGGTLDLVVGKDYKVIAHDRIYTQIITDDGILKRYFSHRFIPIEQVKENTMNNDQKARTMVQNRSYIVGSFDAVGKFSISSEPSEHLTEQKAKTEAKCLAGLDGEKTFVVMRFYAGFKSMQIQEI